MSSTAAASGVVTMQPKVVLSGVTVPAHHTVAAFVLGGTNGAPTDATRVQLQASVSDATAKGRLLARPQKNPAAASGDVLLYSAGDTVSGTFTEPVGTGDMVTFINHGSGAITLTVAVTGYSTEVLASDVSSFDGTAGQVLTNTGGGAAWQPAGHAYGVAGQFTTTPLSDSSQTPVASVSVPAGSYGVTFALSIEQTGTSSQDNVGCFLYSPANDMLAAAYGNTNTVADQSTINGQGLVTNTAGGTITVKCVDGDGSTSVLAPSLIATAIGTIDQSSPAARPSHRRMPATATTR